MGIRKLNTGQVILFGLIACFLYGVGAGLRGDIGILLPYIMPQTNLPYADVSFCIAVMQIVFGTSQPFFGLLASRRSNRFVLILGSVLLIAGLLGIRTTDSFASLFLALGVLFGLGAGAVGFGLVFTSAVYFVGKDNAMLISGMLNAAAGMTGFVFAPLLNHLLDAGGLTYAMLVMSLLAVFLVPVAVIVTSRDPSHQEQTGESKQVNALALIREAASNRTYRLLVIGFTTCGFHMVIIESHLFSQFKSYGIPGDLASWAFSTYGIATILGALLSGFLSTRMKKGKLLTFYYGFRAVWVAIYLFLMPKTFLMAVVFAVGLGMTGDATVSPTSGLVNEQFSIEKVATLVGFLFLCHQIGAFFSAWAGGVLVELTGGYQAIWLIDIVLCLLATFMSNCIVGKK